MDGYIGTLCTYVFDIYCQPKGASIMTLTRDNLFSNMDSLVKKAIQYFWSTRAGQIDKQHQHQTYDQGNRGAVTGGKQLDGFVELVKRVLLVYGLSEACIHTNSSLELPGYYRPNKKWDLLAIHNERLLAAIEFKSQVGPSFGNNFNNRTESHGECFRLMDSLQRRRIRHKSRSLAGICNGLGRLR